MNPVTDQPPPRPLIHRLSTSCLRHPVEQFTGFCPSCLCERLAVLDHSSASASSSSSSRKPPALTTAAAFKAIFKSSGSGAIVVRNKHVSVFAPELRRSKSFSASKNEGFCGVFEPQRKSCDVRGRNTLWSLFNLDDERNPCRNEASRRGEIMLENEELESSGFQGPVFESKDEGEAECETEIEQGREGESRVFEELNVAGSGGMEDRVEEIVEVEELGREQEQEEDAKTMKDHIDLDSHMKKPSGRDFKEIAGSFWSAASVFSKKLQKWRQKQKLKKRRNGAGSATLPVEKPIGRQYRETQSEIADYGFGRRSCDTDPRFSLDAGRISFDEPRNSFDEPRASWDGYLIGRTFSRMPTMLSVLEDAPVHVLRSDNQIPVEEPRKLMKEDERVPGGTEQTRDYYSDSSFRERKSVDRSSSIRNNAAPVVLDMDEMKSVSNAKVSPASIDYIQGRKSVVLDRDLKDSNSNSLRDDCAAETFGMAFRDNASVVGNEAKETSKKSRRWSKAWSIWGFIHRRGGNKDEDEDKLSRANGVERSFSESWQELRREHNGDGDARRALNQKVFRSNSSVSCKNSSSFGGSLGSTRKNNVETNGHGKNRRDEFVLDRNRSARYSPNNAENGLLRFYLTPMRNSRRVGLGKSRPNRAHSIARTLMRLY